MQLVKYFGVNDEYRAMLACEQFIFVSVHIHIVLYIFNIYILISLSVFNCYSGTVIKFIVEITKYNKKSRYYNRI